jgi:hypothetical protein
VRDLNTNLENFKLSRESTRSMTKLIRWRALQMLRCRDTDAAAALHVQRSTTGAFKHSPDAMKLKASGTPMHSQ